MEGEYFLVNSGKLMQATEAEMHLGGSLSRIKGKVHKNFKGEPITCFIPYPYPHREPS